MIKLKEKVVRYEVECNYCGCLLEFDRDDENLSNGYPGDYTKEITCPACNHKTVVRDYYGCLLDSVKPIRTREGIE